LNLYVFCYLGLLRFPEQLEPSLALLPEGQRAEAANILASVKDLSRTELLQRWSRLREDERAAARQNAYKQFGVRLDDMAPPVKEWCLAWLVDQDG
jgi:hypothetical protein